MSEITTFKIVAHMKTPAIIQGDLTLESLLAACVYEETGKMRDEALDLVPIHFIETPEGRIYEASSVMFDGRIKLQQHLVIRGRHFTETGPDFYDGKKRTKGDPWAIDQARLENKRLLNPYQVYEVSRLVWFARGDMKACKELLQTQHWIGKRRGSGFGQVSQWDAQPWTGNPLLTENGLVRRPVPLKKLPFLVDAADVAQQCVISTVDKHPAWAHPPELCAAPHSRKLSDLTAPVAEDSGEIFFFN
jgi:CRISPR type IV-associated protein Csf3